MQPIPFPVLIPLLNPNEPEARVVSLHVSPGQRVAAGQVLCTLETTKSAVDLIAEVEGHVVELRLAEGQMASAGELFCYLSPTPDWRSPEAEAPAGGAIQDDQLSHPAEGIPAGLRITQPALAFARQYRIDLSILPVGPLVTESMLRDLVESPVAFSVPGGDFDPGAIIVYGGGGHGKMVIDMLRAISSYRIIGVIDDGLSQSEMVMGLPVLGGKEALSELHAQGVRQAVNAVGGISNLQSRIQVFHRLAEAGFVCPAIVHPAAITEPSARLSPGAQVLARAYVGSEARLGYGVIIGTGAIVSHDCMIGDFVNISPGALIAGGVEVRQGVLIGMGVTINLGVMVGAGARIGNGATIKDDVGAGEIVRAGTIWPP